MTHLKKRNNLAEAQLINLNKAKEKLRDKMKVLKLENNYAALQKEQISQLQEKWSQFEFMLMEHSKFKGKDLPTKENSKALINSLQKEINELELELKSDEVVSFKMHK